MENDVPLLKAMMSDMALQKSIYQPGPYWQKYADKKYAYILENGISEFRKDTFISKGFGDSPINDPAVFWEKSGTNKAKVKKVLRTLPFFRNMFADYQRYIDSLINTKRSLQSNLIEIEYGNAIRELDPPVGLSEGCETTLNINGTTYSELYIEHVKRIINSREHVPFEECETMMEIGGGFGANIHILLNCYPNIKRVYYIDIPPVLYVGTQYLRSIFGDMVKDYRAGTVFSQEREILCLAPWQIEQCLPVDLFWNAASFAEMPVETVRNYGNFIDAKHYCIIMSGGNPDAASGRSSPAILEEALGKKLKKVEEFLGGGYFVLDRELPK
ncbi:MAG: putative sugar O-methyltransferase [Rhizobiaceae bacterium]